MNKVIICGRLTKDPEVRYTNNGANQMCVARYTIAVDRRGKDAGADFISCVAFDKRGEFAEKYLSKGVKILISGHIQTGSYKNKDGQTVYTTDVIVDDHEFCEKRQEGQPEPTASAPQKKPDEWMAIPDGVEDDGLPFN